MDNRTSVNDKIIQRENNQSKESGDGGVWLGLCSRKKQIVLNASCCGIEVKTYWITIVKNSWQEQDHWTSAVVLLVMWTIVYFTSPSLSLSLDAVWPPSNSGVLCFYFQFPISLAFWISVPLFCFVSLPYLIHIVDLSRLWVNYHPPITTCTVQTLLAFTLSDNPFVFSSTSPSWKHQTILIQNFSPFWWVTGLMH